ncbi:alpha/beta hydrolase fold domain-containing protein [Dactylosporangium sp. CA-139066]|uniref:alpha/beta hydrolase fold domain-containing protein n=1 Tax=Dactylosporangium sp. CA-139066 TaxID=3239930 RepID=UPI003D89E334
MTKMTTGSAAPQPQGAARACAPGTPQPPTGTCRVLAQRRRSVQRHLDTLPGTRDLTVPGGPLGRTWLRVFRPPGARGPLPAVLYVHGADAAFGDPGTQRRASRLAQDVQAAVILVDYSLAPTARVPVALEEDYAAAAWAAEQGAGEGIDGTRIAVCSDRSGEDRARALMVAADRRDGPKLSAHVLHTPRGASVLRAALAL